jgi:SAM-dependent methyltransferase
MIGFPCAPPRIPDLVFNAGFEKQRPTHGLNKGLDVLSPLRHPLTGKGILCQARELFTTNELHHKVSEVMPRPVIAQHQGARCGFPFMANITSANSNTAARLSFDRIAELYDRARGGYPAQLFQDIITFAGRSTLHRALEIGCATGQATRSLADRGIQIVCLEPGENLARLARRNLADFKNVEVVCASFEDWIAEARSFDLVFSANAIHWVDRKLRARKAAELLRPGGTLAIFRSFAVEIDSPIEQAIALAIGGTPPTDKEPKRWPRESEMRKSGYFDNIERRRYETSSDYDAKAYVELLSTLYRYNNMPLEDRTRRFRRIHTIINDNGGTISVRSVTQLLLARRKSRASWWQRFFLGSDGHG